MTELPYASGPGWSVALQYDEVALTASGVHLVNAGPYTVTFFITLNGVEQSRTFGPGVDAIFNFPQRAVTIVTNYKGTQGISLAGLENFRAVMTQ